MLAPSIIACARVRRQGRAGHSRYQSELLPPRPSITWSNELPSLSSVYARASWPQADAATAICSCRPAVTWLSDWPGSRPTVVPSGLRPRAQTAGSVPLTDQPTRALLWSSMATDGVLAPAAVDTGTSACRPVPSALNDRAQTPAAPVWSDSQATMRSPLKFAATAGCRCCPLPKVLAERWDRTTDPFAFARRVSPMLKKPFPSVSSSHTTVASPEADTATSGRWCDPPVWFTVISYAFVAVPVNPAAFTVAAAVPWMSSHTTVKATAVVLPGAPSGSSAHTTTALPRSSRPTSGVTCFQLAPEVPPADSLTS